MARKPARLYLDTSRKSAVWYIYDTGTDGQRIKQPTGLGEGSLREAEKRLAAYVTARDAAEAQASADALGRRLRATKRAPADLSIADLMAWALDNKGSSMARPGEYALRWDLILDYAQDDHLDAVDNAWCDGFVAHAGTQSYGRRCLEDLRAAGNSMVEDEKLTHMPRVKMPDKSPSRPDHLTEDEVWALIKTAWTEPDQQNYPHGPKDSKTYKLVRTSRYRMRHLVPYIVVSVLTCTRASRVYEASYKREDGRPWIDIKNKFYHRLAKGEVERKLKRAPKVPLSDQLVRWLSWRTRDRVRQGVVIPGNKYLVEYKGRPVDCRKAFEQCVERARVRYPDLFLRDDGDPKQIVRHTLRHTGVTLLSQWGVPAADICDYAGMSPEVYDRVYKHADPTKMDRVMDALGGRERAEPKGRRKASEK